ncbi:tRNA (uridine(54)-C5)-methyltransferase TrmA [Pseudidiomarina sp.]|uniref:tRNA (uridine(54)-C5)-methyltransferase TrmA n=1 Tax=Pseudidiomarina sp. TaxID=2081707 RepID=UPI00299D2A47|nr:tRNA (uridine(54)-C5)-methyltransferase TrmA [Pseudidiomarina sp.]MDX1706397.1 tRNA (uridine(54)-C5)-methyltransferase TrmA [Pseudidiomarina sp.]
MTHHSIKTQDYGQQLRAKADYLTQLLQPFVSQPLEIYPSPPLHYRMRAEFRIWHEGDDLYYIMFDPETREKIRMDSFSPGSALINNLMPAVIAYVRSRPVLRRKLFQVEFLTTTTGQALISLIYHRPLEDEWEQSATELKQHLQQFGTIHLIGRSRKQKVILDQDWVTETLVINNQPYHFQQVENSFTQPNAAVNTSMIEWALAATADSQGDLLELYCGNGNFSLPLAQNFDRVLATEISKTSVASARYNCELNDIENVTLVRMSAEDFSAVLAGERSSRRAQEAGIDQFDCATVLVDPPRAGLDEATTELVRQYPTIVYISCNPETLVDNLASLASTHEVVKSALFDQFPYTHHVETGVVLKRRA